MDDNTDNRHTGVIWDIRGPARNGLRWIGYCTVMIRTLACDAWRRPLTFAEADMYTTFSRYVTPAVSADHFLKEKTVKLITPTRPGLPLPDMTSDDALVTLYKTDIKVHHVLTLKPGAWLVTDAIDGYFEVLRMELLQHRSKKNIYIAPSDFFTYLSDARDPRVTVGSIHKEAQPQKVAEVYFLNARSTRTLKPVFMDLDMFVTPVNIENRHWTLLVLYPRKREILFMDSLADTNSWEKVQPYVNAFLNFVDPTGVWKVLDRRIVQQPNAYDCGVYTCAYGAYIIHGRESELDDRFKGLALQYRRHIFTAILSYGKVLKKLQDITEGILYPNDAKTYSDVPDDDVKSSGSDVVIVDSDREDGLVISISDSSSKEDDGDVILLSSDSE